jgi:hypothetical protein
VTSKAEAHAPREKRFQAAQRESGTNEEKPQMKALRQKEKAACDHADDTDDHARIFEKREKAHDESLSEAAAIYAPARGNRRSAAES